MAEKKDNLKTAAVLANVLAVGGMGGAVGVTLNQLPKMQELDACVAKVDAEYSDRPDVSKMSLEEFKKYNERTPQPKIIEQIISDKSKLSKESACYNHYQNEQGGKNFLPTVATLTTLGGIGVVVGSAIGEVRRGRRTLRDALEWKKDKSNSGISRD